MREAIRTEKDLILQDARAPFGAVTFDTFTVESTGTMITTFSSDSLLQQYCSRLWHDSYDNPMPEFTYTEDDWEVKCAVKLPPHASIQTAEGVSTSSRADARRIACFAACKLLYQAGALPDYLLPKPHPLDALVPEPSVAAADDSPTPAHSPSIPDAFKGKWAQGLDSAELHAYTVTFEAIPKDRDYVNFGLFLEAELGPEAGSLEVELQLRGGRRRRVIAKCSPCGTMIFDPHQLREAKLFQERVLSTLLDRKPGKENSGNWSFDRQYLLLPLAQENPEKPPTSLSIDWNSIEKVISDHVEYYDTLDAVPPEVHSVKVYDGYVAVKDITNSLVLTMHNSKDECLYCTRELLPNVKAKSPISIKRPDWNYTSYSDYFERRYKRRLIYVDQPMLEAEWLIKADNLLAPVKPLGDDGAVEELPEDLVHLPLELCRIKVKGLSYQLTNSVSLLPSFMHRLEGFLLALQLRHTLPQLPGVSPVPPNLILNAITTRSCGESFNLEGLETLGDSVLKHFITERLFLSHDKMNEGIMTWLRDNFFSNATLENHGRERGIMNYIRNSPFSPEKSWAAPGRAKRKGHTGTPLKGKTIAHVLEALIGAYYVHNGVDVAQAVMNWFGCVVAVDQGMKAEHRARVHGQPELLPETKIFEVENVLNYIFENKGLLVEAFTHDSCQRNHGDTYERLEYLGDALLDLLITRHFYESSEELRQKPELVSHLRSAALNNECFARVAVRHKLHDYLLYDSSELRVSVENYIKTSQDSTSTSDAQFGWRGDFAPKVLSDLVESLAGAIYLDSDYNLDKVWDVFKELLSPLVTLQTLQLEPINNLHQLCRRSKIGDPEYIFERYSEGDYLISVTIEVNDEIITTFGHSEDKHSAKKITAIEALKALEKLNINKD